MALAFEEVLRDHWPGFARRHRARLADAHYRAKRAVMACRTPAMGGHIWRCRCAQHHSHFVYHSCNHRSCPQCGSMDQQKWAATQEARLLPGVPYFLVTLTVPDGLRPICKREPAVLYDLLMREAAGALKELCQSKLGGTPGFTSVLHTWGRQMQHHPHVHIVIPGVVLDTKGKLVCWPPKPDFLIHGHPLAMRFRNRVEQALKCDHPQLHAKLTDEHPRIFEGKWVADVRHTGSGKPALRYLARYVFRTALGPKRLLGYDAKEREGRKGRKGHKGRIRLLCHESGTNRPHVIALQPDELLRRWATHVLPKGFVRMRHHGWMSGAARKTRLLVRALVCGQLDEPQPQLPSPPVPRCEHCGAEMRLVATISPRGPPRFYS